MIEFTIETDIERPVSEVFEFATDPEKLSRWQTNTISATPEEDGPIQLGSRLHEVHRGPFGKDIRSVVEVSEYEPNRVFALRMVEGSPAIHGRLAFEPTGKGTRMHFTVHGQPGGALRVAQPLLSLALKRQFSEHCSNLKEVLEGSTPPPGN